MSGWQNKLMETYKNKESEAISFKSIQDKDKLWLVVYADVRNVCDTLVHEYLSSINKMMKFDRTVETFVVPCHKDTHIEVLYDPHSTVDNFQEEIEKIKKCIDDYIKNFPKEAK